MNGWSGLLSPLLPQKLPQALGGGRRGGKGAGTQLLLCGTWGWGVRKHRPHCPAGLAGCVTLAGGLSLWIHVLPVRTRTDGSRLAEPRVWGPVCVPGTHKDSPVLRPGPRPAPAGDLCRENSTGEAGGEGVNDRRAPACGRALPAGVQCGAGVQGPRHPSPPPAARGGGWGRGKV